jgi:hypothetical protein
MAERSVRNELDALIKVQLDNMSNTLSRLEAVMNDLDNKVDSVRTSELSAIRETLSTTDARLTAALAKHDTQITLLSDKAGRAAILWGSVTSLVITMIGGAILALVMRH